MSSASVGDTKSKEAQQKEPLCFKCKKQKGTLVWTLPDPYYGYGHCAVLRCQACNLLSENVFYEKHDYNPYQDDFYLGLCDFRLDVCAVLVPRGSGLGCFDSRQRQFIELMCFDCKQRLPTEMMSNTRYHYPVCGGTSRDGDLVLFCTKCAYARRGQLRKVEPLSKQEAPTAAAPPGGPKG